MTMLPEGLCLSDDVFCIAVAGCLVARKGLGARRGELSNGGIHLRVRDMPITKIPTNKDQII